MNFKSTIYVILLLITSFSLIKSQPIDSRYIDSLHSTLTYTQKNIVKIDILNKIADEYWNYGSRNHKDSILFYSNKAINLSRKVNYKLGLAHALYNLGKYYISIENEFAISTPYLLESLSLYEKIDNLAGVSKCYLQLGLTSYILQYYEDAIRNFKLSNKNERNTTAIYLMALSFAELDSIKLAKELLNKVIEEFKKENNMHMMNSAYIYLGRLFNQENISDSALHYLNLSINRIKENKQYNLLVRPYAFISNVYLKIGHIDKAIYYAQQSINLSKKSFDIISLIEASYSLSRAYKQKGNMRQAFHYLELWYQTKEEYIKGSTKQKVAEMQSSFDFRRQWQKDSLHLEQNRLHSEMNYKETILKKNNERNIIIAISVAVLLIAGGLLSRLRYVKRTSSIINQEKNRSEELLLNILPKKVAEELKVNGRIEAKQYNNVTVMITDFVNFTSSAEKMNPKQLIDELHECFSEFDRIIQKFSIEKIKTSGDSYLAVCGLPFPDSEHAEKIVKAAIEIRNFIENRIRIKNDSSFNIRIGINTGSVIAGIVGFKKFAYDIWGDTVNTAARMEQNCQTGKINVSGSTYELIKDKFAFKYRGKITAKNKGQLDMYYVDLSD